MPIKTLIVNSGHTQSSLARALGVPTPQVNKWCRGATPNAASMVKIANILGCSVDEILGRPVKK